MGLKIKQCHLVVGVLTVLVFLATGRYMRIGFPELYEGNEVLRYLYRANHIYILCAGLLNLVLGVYVTMSERAWVQRSQVLGSLLILIAPVLLIAAFFVETTEALPSRPLTALGLQGLFGGSLLHLPKRFSREQKSGGLR